MMSRCRRLGIEPSRRHDFVFLLVGLAALSAGPTRAADEAPPPAAAAPAPAAAAAPAETFSSAQLDQLVAPIALYPDALTVQVLMAATYPLEIVEAARWRAKNASLKDSALDDALEKQDWDPSVESLTHFPELLQRMSDNLDWTKDLGDAFLAQKDDVLDAVQRMRAKAYESGALKTTKEQVVTREVVKETNNVEKEIIRVEPADPQVVYVPQYSPTAVYGAYPAPYYPTMMAYPPGYVATASLLSFGAGMAVGAAVWGDCDWGSHDVYNNNYNNGGGGGGKNQNVNINKEKNVDRSRTNVGGGRGGDRGGGRQKWEHNPQHRGGVRYKDQASAKKFGGRDQVAARDRANQGVDRGYDRGGRGGSASASQRPAGGQTGTGPGKGGRPGAGQGQGGRPGAGQGQGGRPGAGPSQQPAKRGGGGASQASTRGGGQGAFGGYESNRSAREASTRGASSRGSSSYAGSGGGGRGGGGGGGGGRGGGGGGGGRGGGGGGGGRGGGGGGGGRGGRR
jgi:uncharacterized protein DUF3300